LVAEASLSDDLQLPLEIDPLLRCGALFLIVVASLMLPAKLERLRTGHWQIEHFLAYSLARLAPAVHGRWKSYFSPRFSWRPYQV
jgi:hypothetical protein